jgi:hypothetical protein
VNESTQLQVRYLKVSARPIYSPVTLVTCARGGVNAKPRQHRPITTRPHLAPCFYRFIVRVQIRPSNLHLQETYLNFDGCERQRTVVVVAMAPPCRFWQQGNCRNGSMLSPCQAHPLSITSHTRHAPRSFIFLTLFTSLTWRCPFVAKLSSYPCFFFFCLSVCLSMYSLVRFPSTNDPDCPI